MTDKLTVAAYKTNANGGTQITIEHTNEDGRGWGRRLAGPKHYNMGTSTLVSAELDADDAREIRGMLDSVFPEEPSRAELLAMVEQLTKERNRFRFAWNNARARAATLAEDVEFVERQANAAARAATASAGSGAGR